MFNRIHFLRRFAALLGIGVSYSIYTLFMLECQPRPLSAKNSLLAVSMQEIPVRAPGNVQEGKLVHEVLPKYPALTREMKLATVGFNVTVDEAGNVIDVVNTVGYPLCSEAAMRAVMQWKYTPTLINGTDPVAVQIHVNLPCGDPHGKLHPTIAQLIYRIRRGTTADASEKNFVINGLAMLEVTFTESLQQGIERVKKIGFEIVEESGKSKLIGAMPLERINELRSLPGILLVAPHRH